MGKTIDHNYSADFALAFELEFCCCLIGINKATSQMSKASSYFNEMHIAAYSDAHIFNGMIRCCQRQTAI